MGTTWRSIYSDYPQPSNVELLGQMVSLSGRGDILALSGRNLVRTYKLNATNQWQEFGSEITQLIDTNKPTAYLAKNGLRMAVGERTISNYEGRVRVFEFINNNWVQIGSVAGGSANANMGVYGSVALNADGSVLATGSYGALSNAGEVRVFQVNGGTLTQLGNSITGVENGDYLSYVSLSDDGMTLAVGSEGWGVDGDSYAKVYHYETNDWVDTGLQVNFGGIVNLNADGNVVSIGQVSGKNVAVYRRTDGEWSLDFGMQTDLAIEYGTSISLNAGGTVLAVGEFRSTTTTRNGVVRMFTKPAIDTDGDGIPDDVDFCLGTDIPETTVPSKYLLPMHYALLTSGSTTFNGGGDGDPQFTLHDTFGCSCEQILEHCFPGNANGMKKYGCARGIVENFIENKCL